MKDRRSGLEIETKTVKAGCGIRYDPEQLGEDSGFDFSAATMMKPITSSEEEGTEKEKAAHSAADKQDKL